MNVSAIVTYDWNGLFVYDSCVEQPAYSEAVESMIANNISVGTADEVTHIQLPQPGYRTAPIEISSYAIVPPFNDEADHAVEFDLDLPFGELRLEGSGGCKPTDVEIPARVYRARFCGFIDGDSERFLLELWPADVPQPPAEIRRFAA